MDSPLVFQVKKKKAWFSLFQTPTHDMVKINALLNKVIKFNLKMQNSLVRSFLLA